MKHTRKITIAKPARAVNFEELIFVGNGLLGLALSLLNLYSNLNNLLKTNGE